MAAQSRMDGWLFADVHPLIIAKQRLGKNDGAAN
jgi:hypothetical protein